MSNASVAASTSLWQTTTPKTSFLQLASDITVDVAVVGGGITGFTAALLLKQAGLSVAVIEALAIGGGVTGHTTAHIAEVPDIGYQSLISNFGQEGALLAAQSRRAAIEQIARFVQEEEIVCSFQRLPGYLYTESSEDVSYLEGEAIAASQLGIPASLTKDVPLPFPIKEGILFPNQAQFNSLEYLQGLAKAFSTSGGHIFEQTRVLNISGDSPYQLHTQRGSVTARQVILATHTPIHDITSLQDLYLLSTKIAPYRSYVLGVRLRSSPPPVGLFWDTQEPYHYTRTYVDPSAGEFLIVGGADHKTGEKVDTQMSFQKLEVYVRSRFPVESIPYHWSAQWYEPVDGLPFIGKSFAHDQIYVATGYSGNGISFGTVSGMLIADQILGRPNAWSELYDPNRIKPF
ncbi:MAG: FAD-binding oxidoreductase, partial [Cyanobacteriota bacterium]